MRSIEAQQAISTAIVNGDNARTFLPPLLAHQEAWKAYIENCITAEKENTPPKWLMSEFLNPLGFNQAVRRKES